MEIDVAYASKVESERFANGLDTGCERKRRIKEDSKDHSCCFPKQLLEG